MKELTPIEYVLGEEEWYRVYFWFWLTVFPLSDFLFPGPHFPFASALGLELWRPLLLSEGWAVTGSSSLG